MIVITNSPFFETWMMKLAKRCHHQEIVEELSKGWIVFPFRKARPIPTKGPEKHQPFQNLGVNPINTYQLD